MKVGFSLEVNDDANVTSLTNATFGKMIGVTSVLATNYLENDVKLRKNVCWIMPFHNIQESVTLVNKRIHNI
jgi:hypothetical protein